MSKRFVFPMLILGGAIFLACLPALSHASGFGIFTQGAAPLGQAAAVTAHDEAPSSIFYNPALISRLDGTRLEVGTTLLFPTREYRGNSGQAAETGDTVFYPSTLFITHRLSDRVSLGLGVFSPFGLGTDWGRNWDGRYQATNSELITVAVNPVIAVRIAPRLALAAGLDIVYLDTTLERNVDMTPFPLPDNGMKFSGDGTGIGFNIGFLFDVTDRISVGASYRSEVKVGVRGTGTYDYPFQPFGLVNSTGKADLTLPQQVTAGIGFRVSDPLTVEAGIRWEDWSSFRQLSVTFDNGTSQTAPKNWKSTFAYNVGARYRLNNNVSLLAGYLYSDNPVPDNTFEPSIPDADTHLFCVGTEIAFSKVNLALSYGYQMLERRDKANTLGDPNPFAPPGSGTANGRYESNLHLVAASIVYKY